MTANSKKTTSKKPSAKKKVSKKKSTAKKTAKKKTSAKKSSSKKKASKKKTSSKKSTKKTAAHTSKVHRASSTQLDISSEERWRMIAITAYHKAEARGFAPGKEAQDWFEAEKEVDALLKSKK